ncbi:GlxA family transcriptional regulator [Pantoea sp. A4]|uniref:GlxA family transcriptional regulator n=1 Tax=Pantoea sp. A4 TaxID=1225184 RepID=UPI00036D274C|nr:helix-turn-helix domain-containing protein [Pantoea sp. A4]
MFSSPSPALSSARQEIALPGKPELKVGFILMNRFTLIPVAGFVDSLRFAADVSFSSRQIYCQWDWMSVDDKPATASCEMRIEPTRALNNTEHYDYIVLAGGLLEETRDPPEYLLELLRDYHARGTPIIGMCSASFVLGKAGLLRKKRCAVHFTIVDEFRQRFPDAHAVMDKSYIDDQGIITCPGGTAIDLAASLIRKHCGDIRAHKGLEYLLVEDIPAAKKEDESVKSDSMEEHVYKNAVVQRSINFMKANLGMHFTLKDVAEHVGSHPRQLNRVFLANTNCTPASYWRQLRIHHARNLLVNTSQRITTVALNCGFSDASHFILWFRKQYGETPNDYRKRRREIEKLTDRHEKQRFSGHA